MRWMFGRLAPSVTLGALTALVGTAHGDVHQCHVIDIDFTPAENTSVASTRHEPSQIVAWLEKADGTYLDTVYITAQTGRFGLGNRPGRYDFNSGPMWPYGKRVTTFPVWAHRKPERYPEVLFQNMEGFDRCCYNDCVNGQPQNMGQCMTDCTFPDTCDGLTGQSFMFCGENDLSHRSCNSSTEPHYCRPFNINFDPDAEKWAQADAMTCATVAFTDKGKLSTKRESLYPPRIDLLKQAVDSPSVDMYKQLTGFDSVSHATPQYGADETLTWPMPFDTPAGDYVLWVEVSQAFDHNATYNPTTQPPPPNTGPQAITWTEYGMAYRGQPSVVYKVPFTIATHVTTASTDAYVGYGATDGSSMYRGRVVARPEFDYAAPSAADAAETVAVTPTTATVRFVAPGDDGQAGKVSG